MNWDIRITHCRLKQTDAVERVAAPGVARQAPGDQQSTDDYCLAEFPALLSRSGQRRTGLEARASLVTSQPLTFFPSIVANPQTLFFKADTTEAEESCDTQAPCSCALS